MKKTILPVILIIGVIFCIVTEQAFGQTNAPASTPIDLVLLLDTSSSMSSSYEHVSNYVTGAFLNEFLRVGDTFHLIAFSGSQRLDLARRINGVGDVETIIGRLFLQYPIESASNIGAALSYAEQYIASLPNRPKKIVLVSIGANDTGSLVASSRQRLGSRNTTIDFIQVTPGQAIRNPPSSGRPAPVRTAAAAPSSPPAARTAVTTSPAPAAPVAAAPPAAAVTQPPSAAQTQPAVTTPSAPAETRDTSQAQERVTERAAAETVTSPVVSESDETETTDETAAAAVTVDETVSQTQSSEAAERTAEDRTTTVNQQRRESSTRESVAWTSLPFIIGGILLLLLILGLIILLSSRRLGSSPNRVMADASSSGSSSQKTERFADHSKDLASFASSSAGSARRTTPYDDRPAIKGQPVINPSGPLLLNLFVEDQNTAIGRRNIHSLKSGYSLSMGGAKGDDFLVFLVPIPGGIGEVRRSGSTLTFIPRKPKYFPDIGSNEVKDCINKTIRIVSDKNYEMRFRFETYEDPLEALNRMLMSVRVPG